MLASEAEARGEYVDPVAVAAGRVTGRSLADALESAQARWERDDAEAERRGTKKRGERLQFVGLLEDPATRSRAPMTETRRAIERASERFTASVAAQPGGRAADAASWRTWCLRYGRRTGRLAAGGHDDYPGPGPGQLR